MKVHITTEETWICRRLADLLIGLEGFTVCVSTERPRNADISYFLTYLFREFYTPVGKSVGLFTHFIPGDHQKRYDRLAAKVDHCIVISKQHEDYLSRKVGKDRVSRVHLPVLSKESIPPLRVGWFHRSPPGYGTRKRVDLLDSLRSENWIDLVATDDKLTAKETSILMRSVDVFLTTSDYESGPACLLEALSIGKPSVIPRGVGLADEYAHINGVYLFNRGDRQDMKRALWEVYSPLRARYESVLNNTEENWRKSHSDIFRKLFS